MYNRYDHPDIAKVKIARSVLDEMHELGPRGWTIQRKIVVELCRVARPANGVEDAATGNAALETLRRTAAREGNFPDTEQAAINERKGRDATDQ